MNKICWILLFVSLLVLPVIGQSSEVYSEGDTVLIQEVQWEQLNPARGKKSPKAATLWGDRKGGSPTGFLVQFVDGFSSPPHLHNVSYRGVVIEGLIHNDDPVAAKMWMPSGSFWTQPRGEVHITAAKGKVNTAIIEIDSGPYLVLLKEKAYDSGERQINVDPSNLVWLDGSKLGWFGSSASSGNNPKVAFLWGDPHNKKKFGALVKITSESIYQLSSSDSVQRVVVIQGAVNITSSVKNKPQLLYPGSYFSFASKVKYFLSSKGKRESLFYISAKNGLSFNSTQMSELDL